MKNYRDLKVAEKAYVLSLKVYTASQTFPKHELYGLVSQIRRAAISIPSNIAEGCGRNSERELARFLEIAKGSASELDLQLRLSHNLGFLATEIHRELAQDLEEIQKMLAAFILRIRHSL